MSVYEGEFENWDDVVEAFGLDPSTPEPADVFAYAEDTALVIIRKPGDLFDVVEGSYCSYFGLEGQFDPTTDMPRAAVVAMLRDGGGSIGWRLQALDWLASGGL